MAQTELPSHGPHGSPHRQELCDRVQGAPRLNESGRRVKMARDRAQPGQGLRGVLCHHSAPHQPDQHDRECADRYQEEHRDDPIADWILHGVT